MDICHLYCQSHIYKTEIEKFIEQYLEKEKCKRQVYQIHFSYTANNDGYVDHKTHGRGHNSMKELKEDYELLKKYNMANCNYVTEISEDDYLSRKDQIKDINMLYELVNN